MALLLAFLLTLGAWGLVVVAVYEVSQTADKDDNGAVLLPLAIAAFATWWLAGLIEYAIKGEQR